MGRLHVDHRVSVEKGGTNLYSNLQLLIRGCHPPKTDLDVYKTIDKCKVSTDVLGVTSEQKHQRDILKTIYEKQIWDHFGDSPTAKTVIKGMVSVAHLFAFVNLTNADQKVSDKILVQVLDERLWVDNFPKLIPQFFTFAKFNHEKDPELELVKSMIAFGEFIDTTQVKKMPTQDIAGFLVILHFLRITYKNINK